MREATWNIQEETSTDREMLWNVVIALATGALLGVLVRVPLGWGTLLQTLVSVVFFARLSAGWPFGLNLKDHRSTEQVDETWPLVLCSRWQGLRWNLRRGWSVLTMELEARLQTSKPFGCLAQRLSGCAS